MAKWVNGTVSEVKKWTDNLFSLYLSAPIVPFSAGQYAKLALETNGEKIQRAYSYVNAPNNSVLEFYLINVEEGKLSPKLQTLKPGDTVLVTQEATGFFVLNELPDCEVLWMLATGTAIGPYLSILQEGKGLERFKKIILVHAARYYNDLSYLNLMQELVQYYAGKLIIQTITSRETTPTSLTGRIPTLISNGALENAVGHSLSPESSHVMLCGNPQMVRDTQLLLKEQRNMQKHLRRKPGHITSENYW